MVTKSNWTRGGFLGRLDDREQGSKTVRPDATPDVVLGRPLFFVANDRVWLAPDGATEAAGFETRRPEKKPKRFKEILGTARGCPERQREPYHLDGLCTSCSRRHDVTLGSAYCQWMNVLGSVPKVAPPLGDRELTPVQRRPLRNIGVRDDRPSLADRALEAQLCQPRFECRRLHT